jgi:hypothetical protein
VTCARKGGTRERGGDFGRPTHNLREVPRVPPGARPGSREHATRSTLRGPWIALLRNVSRVPPHSVRRGGKEWPGLPLAASRRPVLRRIALPSPQCLASPTITLGCFSGRCESRMVETRERAQESGLSKLSQVRSYPLRSAAPVPDTRSPWRRRAPTPAPATTRTLTTAHCVRIASHCHRHRRCTYPYICICIAHH